MPEGWRRKLRALGGLEPDATRLRDRALHGPRLPDPAPSPARSLIAGAVAIALAVGSFGLLRTTFGDGRDEPDLQSSSPPVPVGMAPDPEEVCDVPEYDPDVALLGDRYDMYVHPAVGPLEVPLDLLKAAGEPGATISGPASDELREFLASREATNAPSGGWRTIVERDDEVIFAAPPDGGYSDWWIVRFVSKDGGWRFEHTELVDQHQTPAQLGRGLRLDWTGNIIVDEGRWESTLSMTNGRDERWSLDEDGYALWGHTHVFDPDTGAEIGHAAQTVGSWVPSPSLEPEEDVALPLSLGGALLELASDRTYDVIACVPELGLASPVGTLHVRENTIVRTARVLTYPHTGISMQALGGGRLVLYNGCLAVASGPDDRRPVYVLWPDGYALVDRGASEPVLIDAVGHEIASFGNEVSLGGGYVPLENADRATIGGIPDACQAGGGGYFLTGGTEG